MWQERVTLFHADPVFPRIFPRDSSLVNTLTLVVVQGGLFPPSSLLTQQIICSLINDLYAIHRQIYPL